MRRPTPAALLLALGSCHSYEPSPVDLAEHSREFAARLQNAPALAPEPDGYHAWNLADGVDAWECRQLALMFEPDCRLARARAGIAGVAADVAGRLPDPTLGVDFERILETVPHPWLAAANVGFTLPLSGRLSAARDLASAQYGAAIAAAVVVEQEVLARTDAAFARFTATEQRAGILRDTVARLRDLEAIATRLAAADELTRAAAREFTLERLQREGELTKEIDARHTAVFELKRLAGLHPDAAVQFVASAGPSPHGDAAHRRERLLSSPRLWTLQRDHDVAERALALEVRGQWPDLVLSPGWSEEAAQPRATLGFSLPLPIFSGNDAAIRTATAERERAAEALRCGFERLVQDLAGAEFRLEAATRRVAFVDQELVPLAAQQVDECRQLVEHGQLEPKLILDAVVRDHEARTSAADARLELVEATAALLALVGAGLDPFATHDTPAPTEERR